MIDPYIPRISGRAASLSVIWIGAMIAALCAPSGAQTSWYVDAGAASPGQGTIAQPFPDIQSAVAAATSGDSVLVLPGTYFGTVDFLGKDIDLSSTLGAAVTTIDALGAGSCVRLFSGESSNARLRGFTIRNGSAQNGGGILLVATSPRIEQCVVTQNSATLGGGGLHADGATPTIVDCSFVSNQSLGHGGAISSFGGANPQVRRCAIIGNTAAQSGGGIATIGARVVVEDTTVENNVAQSGDGGGIYLENAVLTAVRRSILRANVAVSGGGIAQRSGNLIVEQSSLLSNQAQDFGGGVDLSDGTSSFSNSVFTGQTAGLGGGAVFFRSVVPPQASAMFVNVTVRGNAALSFLGGAFLTEDNGLSIGNSVVWENGPVPIFEDAGSSILAAFSTIEFGFPGAAIDTSDPMHVDPIMFDFRLAPTSPCRDAGDDAAAAAWIEDRAGRPRRIGAAVDRGAHEFAPRLSGSNEDLVLTSKVNDRAADIWIHAVTAGAPIEIAVASPLGIWIGFPAIVVVELFATGSPPIGPTGFPEVHLSVGGAVIGTLPPTVLSGNPTGSTALAPVGLAGSSIRLQALVVDPSAQNGFFAITDAHDLVFF